MRRREEILKKFPYKIWEGKDGKWRTYLPDEENRRKLIKRSNKKDVENKVIAYCEAELKNQTIKDVFYEWIKRKLEYQDICIGTFNRYEKDFRRFFEDEICFANMYIKDIKPDDIIPFLRKAIVKYSLTSKAYSNLRTLVLGIFKYAKEKEYISWSISQTINDMDLPKKSFYKVIKEDNEEVFDDDEINVLLKQLMLQPDILNLGIVLMFCTGIRVGELVAIKWDDIINNTIKIHRTEISYKNSNGINIYEIRDYPKTEAGIRRVFIPNEFSSIIKQMKILSENDEYVFYKNGHHIKTTQIRKRLYYICNKCNIKKKSPHKLRKTYISILLDNGVDNRLIQDVVGHTNISTSEKNYHRNRKSDDKKEMILSNLPEFKNVDYFKSNQK